MTENGQNLISVRNPNPYVLEVLPRFRLSRTKGHHPKTRFDAFISGKADTQFGNFPKRLATKYLQSMKRKSSKHYEHSMTVLKSVEL